jgi:cell division protein FtsZ
MIKPGMINLDFADIRAVMSEMGKAMMGTGEASGETRATQAAEAAINNPLLDDTTMQGARSVLINVTGGLDMTLFEVDEAANRIRKEIDPEAVIIFGSAFDEKLDGVMRVSVVATGIDANNAKAKAPLHQPKIDVPTPQTISAAPPMTTSPVQAHAMTSAISNPMAKAKEDATPASTSIVRESISTLAKEAIEVTNSSDDKVDSADEASADSKAQDTSMSNAASASESDITAEVENTQSDSEPKETQLELTDAVAAASAKTDTDADSDTDKDVATKATTDTASLTSRLMPRFNLENEGQAKVEDAPRKTFIPAAPTAMPDEASVPKASETSMARPTSIIKQISELWSSKPNSSDNQKRNEPNVLAKDTDEDKTSSVLDLPQSAVVKPASDPAPTAQLEQPDDELDIPAFLRRQVN